MNLREKIDVWTSSTDFNYFVCDVEDALYEYGFIKYVKCERIRLMFASIPFREIVDDIT